MRHDTKGRYHCEATVLLFVNQTMLPVLPCAEHFICMTSTTCSESYKTHFLST